MNSILRLTVFATAFLITACASNANPEMSPADRAVIDSIHQKVRKNWYAMPYIDSPKRSTTVSITVLPDGSAPELAVTKSSGNTNFDNGLLVAIHQAEPFAVPAAVKEPVHYSLTFTN